MKIQLPGFIIAELYKDSLVITGDTVTTTKNAAGHETTKLPVSKNTKPLEINQKKWFLGNNKKNISIVVKDESNVFLDDDSLQLLSGILAACRLNLADVAIINYHQNAFSYEEIKTQLQPSYFLLFDVPPPQVQLPFNIPNYQVQQYDNCTFLLSASLKKMHGSTAAVKTEKTKLWVCLKNIFQV